MFADWLILLFLKIQAKTAASGQGELFTFGRNDEGQLGLGDRKNRYTPTLVMEDKTIRQIIYGSFDTFILKESGELFAFGYSRYKSIPRLITTLENMVSINGVIVEK